MKSFVIFCSLVHLVKDAKHTLCSMYFDLVYSFHKTSLQQIPNLYSSDGLKTLTYHVQAKQYQSKIIASIIKERELH